MQAQRLIKLRTSNWLAAARDNSNVCLQPGFYQCDNCIGQNDEILMADMRRRDLRYDSPPKIPIIDPLNRGYPGTKTFCWNKWCIREKYLHNMLGRSGFFDKDFITHPIDGTELDYEGYNKGEQERNQCR